MYSHPLVSPLIERHIHVKGKFFKYKVAGRTYRNDDYIISESLKEAFCLILDTYMSLKNKDVKSLRIASEVSGNSNYKTLLGSIEKVGLKILDNVLVIIRENYLDTENDNVLASIDKNDKKTFTVYDKFFDQVGFKENRAGIFIHKIAHLCDFDEEDEMRELDSAECIKNICLCINGKITLEQIKAKHKKQQQNPQKDRRDGVLTYRPNGSRDSDGRYNSQKDGTGGAPTGGSSASAGGSQNSNIGNNNTSEASTSNLFKNFYGDNNQNAYTESKLGASLNLNLPSFKNFDPIKHINSLNKNSTYMEPRIEKLPENRY